MKTQTFTIGMILILLLSLSVSAEHVSKEDAALIGKNYYWENCNKTQILNYDQVNLSLASEENLNGVTAFYIFNINQNDGFIIVTADDHLKPIAGYTTSGSWTGTEIPASLSYLLSNYTAQAAEVISNGIESTGEIDALWDRYEKFVPAAPGAKSVTPLLSTTWNQNQYYNQQCPWDISGPGGHAYAGCVATSMAQVMKYWQHPSQGSGSNSYIHPTYGNISANFAAATYNYAMMPNSIFTTNTNIAQLIFHCGVAVNMNYGPTASLPFGPNWEQDILNALQNNFSYNNNIYWNYRSNYANMSAWEAAVKSELDLSRPLVYVGYDSGYNMGHAFNVDGYNSMNYFHVNWGWSGWYDGYYSLSSLNPAVGYDFTYGQRAIFGLIPSTGNFDWGDAPDNPGYPTLSASTGACHQIPATPNLFLGSLIDAESDGQPHVNCIGDDNNNLDDEDGVVFPMLSQGATVTLTVNAYGAGLLDAWMDFNQDGDWADSGEQIFTNKSLYHGTNNVTLNIPASAYVGWTYARFRYSTQGNLSYTGLAQDGEVEDYFIRIEEEGQAVNDDYMLFSVDIGSDAEISDPVIDGDEVFDPGDAYLHPGTYMNMPGTEGLIDDVMGFGMDPFPDGGVPGTGAPCLCGMPIGIIKHDFFDMDGIDLAICDMREYPFGEGQPPVEKFEDDFIHDTDSLYISYDDDDFMPYSDPTGSIPRLGFSSIGMLYGQTATKDEVLEVDIDIVYPLSGQLISINPKYDEATIHPNLAPNPDINAAMPNDHDDDVDALDVPLNLEDITRTYFSADHEAIYFDHAGNPINPGSIYLAENGKAYEVINAQTDIGLFPDTDIDAFEFTWMEYPDPDHNYMALAMIFSVDEDDPTTPGDESGGMMPNAIYVTWMTGWWFDLVPDGFMDDIDAITIVPAKANPVSPKADFSPVNSMIYAGQSIVFTDLSTGNPTAWNWTFTGGNPSSFNGSTPPAVQYNTPGSYPVSLTVTNANGTETKSGTVNVMPQGWQHTVTNVSHIISVPLSANPSLNGAPLNNGDLMGVFYTDNNGNEICGGYGIWDGMNNISVQAYGDDGSTPQKDGFLNGEFLKWKVYSWGTLSSHDVSVTYDQSQPQYDGNYYDNGISALLSMNTYSTQTINLFKGWNGLSSYLNPVNPNIDTMMSPIGNELIILRNLTGVYWPGAGINTLMSWNTTSGYVAKVSQDAVLTVNGNALTSRTLTLNPGWHIIPILSSTATATSSLFNIPQVMLVKEIAGPGVYWPAMGITTLVMLHPGESYYVYVTSPVIINFPAKSATIGSTLPVESGSVVSPWPTVKPTPGSHLVAISKAGSSLFNIGDVIGAFNSNGLCVGYSIITGTDQVMAIYADDPTTSQIDGMIEGEPITYRRYNINNSEDELLDVSSGGDSMNDCNYFTPNGISLLELKTGIKGVTDLESIKVFPNPASRYIKINLNETSGSARLIVCDVIGNEIINTTANAAETTLDVSGLAEGCYLLSVSVSKQVITKKIVIRK